MALAERDAEPLGVSAARWAAAVEDRIARLVSYRSGSNRPRMALGLALPLTLALGFEELFGQGGRERWVEIG